MEGAVSWVMSTLFASAVCTLPVKVPSPRPSAPFNESIRQAWLDECQILDTPPEQDFDDLAQLAAQICGTPIALISLLDHDRQWFKSRVGLEATETLRELAFCAHAIIEPDEMMVVNDATLDVRFSSNPLVTGEMGIRFYAGAPLVAEPGVALGTLCVIDTKPRHLTPEQEAALSALARQAVSQFQLRRQNLALLKATIERERFFTLPLDMLCIAGMDGYFKLLNPAFSEALGYTAEELMAEPLLSFLHPADVEATQRELQRLERGLTTLDFENRYRCKDGSYRHLSWKCAPAPEGLIYASARDVTAKRQAEEQLTLSQDLIKQFVKHAPAAIAMLDTEMRYLQVSDRWLTDYHLGAQDVIGRSHYDVFPDIPMRWKEIHCRVLRGAVERNDEDPFPRADGRVDWLQWEARPWFRAPGEIGGLIFSTQVITERKETEQRLQNLSEMQRAILDSAAYSVIATTPEGIITEFNPAAERMLGYAREEVIGKVTLALIHDPAEVQERACAFGAELGVELDSGFEVFVAKTRRHLPNEDEWTYIRKDGGRFPVQLSVTALRDEEDRVTGFLGIAVDITGRKENEAAMRASLSEKEALLQEIHHRVKNNLQVISSLLSLQSGYIRDEATLVQFQECQGRIRSMALIHEKLYQSETLACVDLKDYLDGLARMIFSTYAMGGNLKLDLSLDPVRASIDTAVPLGLLVNELMTNAAKYAFPEHRPGCVRLTLRAGDEGAFTLALEDDGIGLPAGFQMNSAKTLGMRLIGMFVKQLDGKLEITTAPGHTCFRIEGKGSLELLS